MDDGLVGPIGGIIVGALLATGITLNADSLFKEAYPEVLEIEGGFVDHVNDRGGATNWGITERTARHCGYIGSMEEMPVEFAVKCAWENYWVPLGLDAIATTEDTVYKALAIKLFEIGYHAGPRASGRSIQRCLNDFNDRERLYRDIAVDGKIGRSTVRAFKAYREHRGVHGHEPLLGCVKTDYCSFLLRLVRRDESQEAFAWGWIRSRCS